MGYGIINITKEISEVKALDNSFKLSTGMRLTFVKMRKRSLRTPLFEL
jgi:hypothetical protein